MSKEFIAQVLREKRIACGIPVKDIAKQIGNSEKTIYGWENAHSQPDIDSFVTLCQLYNIRSFDVFLEDPSERAEYSNAALHIAAAYERALLPVQAAARALLGVENE